jgi:1,2-dihydroxy-3-keto-5-methylthiopentene dioxygenase
MSCLIVYHDATYDQPNKVLTHAEDITSTLAEQGIGFYRLRANGAVVAGAPAEQIANVYATELDRLLTAHGMQTHEIFSFSRDRGPETGLEQSIPQDWAQEHSYAAGETRWVVAGRMSCALHVGECVYLVICEKHDVLQIPAGVLQWIDLGERPDLSVVRLWKDAQGSVQTPTGSALAEQFPGLEDCL